MARQDPIARYLPHTFANGTSVRRFAKPCPRCRQVVEAADMFGQLAVLQDRLFVAAEGRCRHCGHRFSVACMITNNKHVHRVALPMWAFKLWLKMATRNTIQPADPAWSMSEPEPEPVTPSLDEADVVAADTIVGRYDGLEIPAWINHDGHRYNFERTIASGQAPRLAASEQLFRERLVYRRENSLDVTV
ncbi:hypothetical protein QU487_12985 [Crenobacter sp. SG2305]|uniref:hypothetical protein n=1 Tax=Crenobacter oryzisoli TaxID=3056844 RepID=UPI0025AB0F59|nr:hypothetical protein [Crenobacter sp. SG2305]MDN0083660.1 hypothetical protein [Crenobacter sp. SG2305]